MLSFRRVDPHKGGVLVAVNPRTGGERVLVKDLDMVYSAAWSADGRWVAYLAPAESACELCLAHLWVVDPSLEPRQVATGGKPGRLQSLELSWMWSRTGAELATIDGSTLSTIDPVTGETTVVGSFPELGGDVGPAAWSPDGTRIVFGARGGAIYSIDVRTGGLSPFVRLPGENLDSVDQILWSPDGAHIAVMNDLEPGGGRLYVMDADGSNVRVLVDDFNPAGVAWSPDGTRLAYAGIQGLGVKGRIWVAPMDGSAPAEIGRPPASCGPRFLVCGEVTWSPDGSRIAFLTYGATGDGSVLVSAFDADGSGQVESITELTYRSWEGGGYSCGCT